MHRSLADFVKTISPERLYWRPAERKSSVQMLSVGECILRSAGAVEQTFGGITAKLWDDPFEWTLPEELSTIGKIQEYLAEVEKTRQTGFAFFRSDEDLYKQIPAPEELKTIGEILIETIVRAGHFQGRAWAVRQLFDEEKLEF